MDYMKELGIAIRERREEVKMTKKEFAELLGYKKESSITKLEAGKTELGINELVKISDILELDLETLKKFPKVYEGAIFINTKKHPNLNLRLNEEEADSLIDLIEASSSINPIDINKREVNNELE